MPIIIALVAVVALIGARAYFSSAPVPSDPTNQEELARLEETDNGSTEVVGGSSESENNSLLEFEASHSADVGDAIPAAPSPYSSSATYLTPARTSHTIDVTLTLDEQNIVVGANVVYDSSGGYSNSNQERFDGAYRAEVVGKPIDQISLSRVGGASLTSEAFNEAVANIKTKIN